MKSNRTDIQLIAIYAVLLGILYALVGAIKFLTGIMDLVALGDSEGILGIRPDIYGGLATLVIGSSYLATIPLWKGKYESIGFALMATILSIIFGVLYLLMVGADGMSALLAYWDGAEWTLEWLTNGTTGAGIFKPEIWLAFVSIPLGYFIFKKIRSQETKVKKLR
ncbi:MAG: hypothetical protein ACTSYL_12405 [Candidatus Thorarchaeota archaeon]